MWQKSLSFASSKATIKHSVMTIRHTISCGILACMPCGAIHAQASMPKLTGLVNIRYQMEQDKHEAVNSFDIRRARLGVKGDIGKGIDYRLQVELAGTAKVLDAHVGYTFLKELKVQAGEFKIPFTLENAYGPASLETAENSLAVQRLCNYNDVCGIKANGRDIGVMLHGSAIGKDGYDMINYEAGVFNGRGINLKDENDDKDYAARLTVKPMKALSVSVSGYYGTYGEGSKESPKQRRYRAAAGAKYDDGKWLARAEYIYGKTGGADSEGAYAMAAYQILPQLQALLKYDYYADNRNVKATAEHDYQVALNYRPEKQFRVQACYTYKTYKSGQLDNNVLAIQLFAQF